MQRIDKLTQFDVRVKTPPSKAHTLRALLLASLAEGTSAIRNPLLGQDQLHLIECLRGLGTRVEVMPDVVMVQGNGGHFDPRTDTLDAGESGVTMNFLASAANLSSKPVVITGAPGLLARPVAEVVDGLRQLGCRIDYLGRSGFPPVKTWGPSIQGGRAAVRGGTTSQYFSSIVLAAPYATSPVVLQCADRMSERPYFDMTLDMMARFGVKAVNDEYSNIEISNARGYRGCAMTVEGDYSSASFFFLAAAICRTRVTVSGLSFDSRQGDRRFVDILQNMGCSVCAGDDVVTVSGGKMRGCSVDMRDTPDLVPCLSVAAAFAHGTSTFSGVGHLRHKECDRLAAIVSELGKMGVTAACDEDSLTVKGSSKIHGARIDPHNDHRTAMSFAIAGLATGDQVIDDEMCVAKSFPDFWERTQVFQRK